MVSRRLRSLLCLASLTLAAAALHAEPSEEQKKVARNAMAEGRELRDEKDLKGALEAFKKAHAIMDVPTTGLEVARTLEMMGMLVEARAAALDTTKIPKSPREPPPFQTARDDAQKLVDDLNQRIPKLTIAVKGVPKGDLVELHVDGKPVPPSQVGTPLDQNPGTHHVEAKHGDDVLTADVELREGESRDVPFEFKPKTQSFVAPPASSGPPVPHEERSPWRRPVVLAGIGVAGVGVIAGSITGVLAMSKASSAKKGCVDNECPPSTHGDIDSGKTMATISNISFGVAIVGAAVGVYGLLTAPKEETPPSAAWVKPYIGIGSLGVRGSF